MKLNIVAIDSALDNEIPFSLAEFSPLVWCKTWFQIFRGYKSVKVKRSIFVLLFFILPIQNQITQILEFKPFFRWGWWVGLRNHFYFVINVLQRFFVPFYAPVCYYFTFVSNHNKSIVKPKNNAGFIPVFVQSVHGWKDWMPTDSPIKVASVVDAFLKFFKG